jgi:predicted ATPase/DNA-binding SARP family transcriptional activator
VTHLALTLFGPLQIAYADTPVRGFESDKVRALLIFLVVEADRPHRRAALAELLWPERPERAALLNLNQALANLRRALGERAAAQPLLRVTRESIQLNPAAAYTLDLSVFHALLDACVTHAHRDPIGCAACAERLTQAVALYRGDALAGFAPRDCLPFQEWALLLRERAHRRLLEALTWLAAYHERCGDVAAALAAGRRLLEHDPWREEAHRLVMRLLWECGQRSAALAQYERCREVLSAELGVAPDAETEALAARLRAETPTAAPPEPVAGRLPHPATPFLGRTAELARLAAYLADPACRLVTIVGLGGSGKTRLAIAAATAGRRLFADGVVFVALASAGDTGELLLPLARTLQIQLAGGDGPAQIGAALAGRNLLLVLDNLEQIAGAGTVVAALLAAAPDLTILATSRERLGLQAEWTLDLAGLSLPAADEALESVAATALFLQAARRAQADFAPQPGDAPAIRAICRRLAGHPLAIELAASWVRVLACPAIAAELAAGLDLLSGGAADLPERHRAIRATFATTWRLLPAAERQALEQLALCVDGFDRAAAQQIAGAGLPHLAALADKSLLAQNAVGRYTMHELVRQYAQERLAERGAQAAAAAAHAGYYLALVEQAGPHMKGPAEATWMERLEADHTNILLALDQLAQSDRPAELAERCEVLRWFWYIRGHLHIGRAWMERATQAPPAAIPPARRAKLLQGAGIFADELGDYATAAERYIGALSLYEALDDARGVQATSNSMGMLAWAQGRYAEAQVCFERSLRICRELAHHWGVANSLNSLGTALQAQGDVSGAAACFAEALTVARAVDYPQLTTLILDNVGDAARLAGDGDRAAAAYSEALALQLAGGDSRGAALSRQGLGLLALARGDLQRAAEELYTGLRAAWRLANRRELSTYLDNLAALLAAQSQFAAAARLCGAAQALRERIGTPLTAYEAAVFAQARDAAQAALPAAEFHTAWASGAATPLEQLIDETLHAAGA